MGVDHDSVFRGLLDGIQVVVDEPLAVMVLAAGNDRPDIAAFDGPVAVLPHETVGIVETALVVADRRRGFVVHDHLHAPFAGVFADRFEVEVRVGRHEVEHPVLRVPEPVLPAFVPALDQHAVEAVPGGEVDVTHDVFGRGSVPAVGADLRVVGFAELHRRELVGVGPAALPGDHLPPDPDVLHRADPRRILDAARFVEVEREATGQDVAGVVADDYGPPRRDARSLQIAFGALGVGCEPRFQREALVVEVQVHAGEVDERRFVDVDVESVVGFQQQGGLYAGGREDMTSRISESRETV